MSMLPFALCKLYTRSDRILLGEGPKKQSFDRHILSEVEGLRMTFQLAKER